MPSHLDKPTRPFQTTSPSASSDPQNPDPGPRTPDLGADDPITRLFETRSSILEKVPPPLRRKINCAIIDRQPPTYPAVYKQYDLRNMGVSAAAFSATPIACVCTPPPVPPRSRPHPRVSPSRWAPSSWC